MGIYLMGYGRVGKRGEGGRRGRAEREEDKQEGREGGEEKLLWERDRKEGAQAESRRKIHLP